MTHSSLLAGLPLVGRWITAALLVGLLTQVGRGQESDSPEPGESAPTSDLAWLERFEGILAETIARCERSVVSITRDQRSLEQLARPTAPRPRRPQIFANGRAAPLPGGLGALQTPSFTPRAPVGAGVVIDSDAGLVLTQYAVVAKGESHLITDLDGNHYAATIRAAEPRSNLAVLQLQTRFPDRDDDTPIRLPALRIGKAEELRKGRFVIAIGNPFSIESDGQPTASWGTITNTARKAHDSTDLDGQPLDGSYRTTLHHFGSLMQTDARLGWNASGGAVINLAGELVGITTTVGTIVGHESPAGYAIPLNEAMRRAVDDLSRGRAPEYGFLGISGFSPSRSTTTGTRGIRVGRALVGGPAYQAGLRGNELITHINGKPITNINNLQLTVGSLPTGATVPVAYEVAGEKQEAEVILGKAFVSPAATLRTRPRYPLWRGIRVDYATATPEWQAATTDGRIDPQGCVVVSEVDEQSVSWAQGVRPNAFVSHVSDRRVTKPAEFYEAIRAIEQVGNEKVRLKFTKPQAAARDAARALLPQ